LRIDLSYDGTAFAGWAAQRDQRTVQGELEQALARVLRRDDLPHLVVAGRTDAGVHARGQVAHLDVPHPPRLGEHLNGSVEVVSPSRSTSKAPFTQGPGGWDVSAVTPGERADHASAEAPAELLAELTAPTAGQAPLLRRLNGTLPHDIRIRRVTLAHRDFDARFCGLSRTYSYRIADRPEAVDPLRRFDTLHWPRPLDLAALQEASAGLAGLHDFAAFCKKREGSTTVRCLNRLDWVRDDTGVLIATVEADAFCHSMVRSLMGALIAVGEGRQPVTWPASLLTLTTRSSGVLVAPPQGLTLERVDYPPDDQLAARQRVTRNPRA